MQERFPIPSPTTLETRKIAGDFAYDIDEDGTYVFQDVNIGGMVGQEDFRDFIVNRERVGIRMDSTLVLPKETAFKTLEDGTVEFTLPRSKQQGILMKQGGAAYAIPKSE